MKKQKNIKQTLKNKLTKKELSIMPSSFDIVGDILIFSDFPKDLTKKEKLIANALLSLHKNVKVIAKKTKKYSGKFRTPKLKIIAGLNKKETIHKENNVSLKLDVEKVYFSPRLSNERKRIANSTKKNESILVMFSGVGVYPCVIAKNSEPKEIYAIEINQIAHKYALENIKLNKINNIKLILGDVKKVVPKLNKKFDRILMPLPKGAENFLDIALKAVKKRGTIHFYTFLDEKDINKKFVKKYLNKYIKKFKILNIQKCGQFSPRVYRICVDFKVL